MSTAAAAIRTAGEIVFEAYADELHRRGRHTIAWRHLHPDDRRAWEAAGTALARSLTGAPAPARPPVPLRPRET